MKNNNKQEAAIAGIVSKQTSLSLLLKEITDDLNKISPTIVQAMERRNTQRKVLGMGPEMKYNKRGASQGVFDEIHEDSDPLRLSLNNARCAKIQPPVRARRTVRNNGILAKDKESVKDKKRKCVHKGKLIKGSGKCVSVDLQVETVKRCLAAFEISEAECHKVK